MQPIGVVPGRLKRRGFQPDQRAELGGVMNREIEHDAAADRAAEHDRPLELERGAERPDRFGVGRGGEPVFLVVPAIGRRRLAVPGQVEGDDAERIGDRRIGHHVPELAAVGARRMQANQRDALSRLLEVEAMRPALQRHMEIAPDDRIEPRGHQRASRAGAVS